MKNALSYGKMKLQIAASKLMKKDLAGKELIVEIGLIIVGVALLVAFRTQIAGVVTELVNSSKTKISAVLPTT